MAGHNKWSKIKRKKGVNDSRRSKEFTRIVKEMMVSVKEGGPDPDMNPRLRMAINNARAVNMPKENIQRAISKASDKDSAAFQELTYEGYSAGGVAIFIESTTDNSNRTIADVRLCFTKTNGTLGNSGSLSFVFDRKGNFLIAKKSMTKEKWDSLELDLIDGGAEEIEEEDEYFNIITSFTDFGNMQKKLESLQIEVEKAELQRIPKNYVSTSAENAKVVLKLIEMLEELEDVQNVFHNMEMSAEIEQILMA